MEAQCQYSTMLAPLDEMGVDVLAHLAVVGRELDCGAPAGGLGVGLSDQEIARA